MDAVVLPQRMGNSGGNAVCSAAPPGAAIGHGVAVGDLFRALARIDYLLDDRHSPAAPTPDQRTQRDIAAIGSSTPALRYPPSYCLPETRPTGDGGGQTGRTFGLHAHSGRQHCRIDRPDRRFY